MSIEAMKEDEVSDNFPVEAIHKLKDGFFKLANEIANDDPKITDTAYAMSFIATACLNITAKMLCLLAEQVKQPPEEVRAVWIKALNDYEFIVENIH